MSVRLHFPYIPISNLPPAVRRWDAEHGQYILSPEFQSLIWDTKVCNMHYAHLITLYTGFHKALEPLLLLILSYLKEDGEWFPQIVSEICSLAIPLSLGEHDYWSLTEISGLKAGIGVERQKNMRSMELTFQHMVHPIMRFEWEGRPGIAYMYAKYVGNTPTCLTLRAVYTWAPETYVLFEAICIQASGEGAIPDRNTHDKLRLPVEEHLLCQVEETQDLWADARYQVLEKQEIFMRIRMTALNMLNKGVRLVDYASAPPRLKNVEIDWIQIETTRTAGRCRVIKLKA